MILFLHSFKIHSNYLCYIANQLLFACANFSRDSRGERIIVAVFLAVNQSLGFYINMDVDKAWLRKLVAANWFISG